MSFKLCLKCFYFLDDLKMLLFLQSVFLDASTHLYKRVCPSVVGRSVRPSVCPSVSRFFYIAEITWKRHRITGKQNLTNLTNLSDKSILVPNFRRIFVYEQTCFSKSTPPTSLPLLHFTKMTFIRPCFMRISRE